MTKKILVVDDQPTIRSARALAIRRAGYHVDEAASGLDALRRSIAENYDVILMDYDMPFMNGPDCTQKIREYETGTAAKSIIIGVTSSLDSSMQQKCLTAGMDAYMDQATSSEALQQLVREWAVTA
jgi:two-component system sensor histidine kinase/response regulator